MKPKLTPKQQLALDLEKLNQKGGEKDKKYRLAIKQLTTARRELETILSVRNNISTFKIAPTKHNGGEAVAVAVASDWHVEERVDPDTVNGINTYTLTIAKERAERFFQRLLKMVAKERQSVEINTLVLALLGDFFSGNIHDELLETCELQPQDAMLYAQNLLASGIEFLLANSDLTIICPCSVGNHSRMTHKVHVSTEHGNSLEWAMYHFLAGYFKKESRVKFVLSRSYHCYVEVYGYVLRFHHGHAMTYNSGVGGIEIGVRRRIKMWNETKRADLDIFGHFHTRRDGGNFIANGSLIGPSAYGMRYGFADRPEQAFFLIDQKRGKTVVAPILVD